jgi:hypothetical protein
MHVRSVALKIEVGEEVLIIWMYSRQKQGLAFRSAEAASSMVRRPSTAKSVAGRDCPKLSPNIQAKTDLPCY